MAHDQVEDGDAEPLGIYFLDRSPILAIAVAMSAAVLLVVLVTGYGGGVA